MLLAKVLLAFLIGTAGNACGERLASHYSNLDEAERQGAIARGWVPNTVPRSAIDIREIHYIDKTESWGAFGLPAADAESFGDDLEPLSPQGISELHVRSPGEDWWPAELVGDLVADGINAAGISVFMFREPEATVYFAVKRQERRVFYWRP